MIGLYHGDAKRIQHFCKVHSYAKLIAEMENVDAKTLFILETAALTHDIGIHLCEEKYGNCNGKLQEKEGPAIAAKLLAELRDVPEEKRTARFCCVIAAAFPDGKTVVAQGECEGRIGFEKKGDGDFGYDPLFYYPPFDKTFAEMTANEKNSVSHRGRAVKAFCKKFFG